MSEPFDLFETIDAALAECRGSVNAVNAGMERIERLRVKLAAEFDRLRAERDSIEAFNETAAAEALGIKQDHLQQMRLDAINAGQPFPHVAFGKLIRYTRQNLRDIVAIHGVGTVTAKHTNLREIRRAA